MSEEKAESVKTNVTFKLSDDELKLIAVLPAGSNIPPLNVMQLNKLILEEGHTDWRLINDALAKVCGQLGKLEDETEIVIGERLDGEVEINIANDASCVTMTVTPPIGGNPVTVAQVYEMLSARGVIEGIKKDAIQHALSMNAADKFLITEGVPPQHGVDSQFESLIDKAKDNRPHVNKDGSVNYHEIGAFITVNAGDKLMRKIPPTAGTNGVDIYGKVIPAKPGKDVPFSKKMVGVEFDAKDKNILLASTGGQPEVIEHGMTVSPVINVKDVDLSTGNIDFDGSVNIQGDIAEGMKIIASGDIIVAGMMEGADLQAGGNILISKGVIGRGELRTEEGEPGHGAAKLKSGGSIEARFIENAIVSADENITVGELVSHSELSALNQIVVGKKGAKKGHILGGKASAMVAIDAQVLGSQANVKTSVEVGNDPAQHEKMLQATKAYESKKEECEKLSTLIKRLKGQADEKSKATMLRALSTLKKLNEELTEIKAETSQLEAQNELTASAKVKVGKQAFPGVSVSICDKTLSLQNRKEAGVFVLENHKKVVFIPS